MSGPRGCLLPGRLSPEGVPGPGGDWWRPPPTATAAGGKHPTGMYSCYLNIWPM